MLGEEESAELAELRRRAWGEDADLFDDPSALSRLQELEEKARPVAVVRPPSLDRSPSLSRGGTDDQRRGDPSTGSGTAGGSGTEGGSETESTLIAEEPPLQEIPRTGAKRGILLVVGVVITVLALAAGVRSILIPSPVPVASPSPTFTRAAKVLPALACGDGWGLSGSLSTPDGKPVWSRQFDFPISESEIVPASGPRMIGVWANLDVYPGTVSDVEVVSPTTARLFYTAVKNWTAPASPEDIIRNSSNAIVLPECANPDSYPGYILARAPACVTLEFTIDGTRHYTVRTPVGIDEGARCPTR